MTDQTSPDDFDQARSTIEFVMDLLYPLPNHLKWDVLLNCLARVYLEGEDYTDDRVAFLRVITNELNNTIKHYLKRGKD